MFMMVFCLRKRFANVSHDIHHHHRGLGQISAIICQTLKLLLSAISDCHTKVKIFEPKRNLSLNKYPNNKTINQTTHKQCLTKQSRSLFWKSKNTKLKSRLLFVEIVITSK
jgi:hypothetical protein